MKTLFLTLLAGGLGASVPWLHLTPEPATTTTVVVSGVPHGKKAAAVSVLNGDTLIVAAEGHTVTVRLDGIEAPLPGQPGEADAAAALRSLVKSRPLSITFTGRDADGIALTRIRTGATDVAERQLRQGWGWFREAREADIDSAVLADAEAEAQLLRRGLWAGVTPLSPANWRKAHPEIAK